MQKNTIKITFYLIIFSFIAKLLSFLSRIILARNISTDAMSIFSLLSPTIVILITCVQMGIPSILAKIVAKKGYTYKDLATSIYFNIFTTCITSIIFIILIPHLSHLIYKTNYQTVFYCILPYLPLVSLSGILKGYLLGQQKFLQSSFSQIIEEISRISFLLVLFRFFKIQDSLSMAKLCMLAMIVGEFISCIYMLLLLLIKKHHIKDKMKFSKESLKYILQDAIPLSGSRLIGSFSYFLEPILMNMYLSYKLSRKIQLSYGILNGYVLPLLTMPSFLTNALSSFLLPSFSYQYSRNNINKANKMLFSIMYFCLFINVIYCLVLFFYSDQVCMLIYHTIEPSYLLKRCCIPFMIYALQPITSNMLQVFNLSKYSTFDTLSGSILRLLCVTFLTPFLEEKALVIGLCGGMMLTTTLHVLRVTFQKKRYK